MVGWGFFCLLYFLCSFLFPGLVFLLDRVQHVCTFFNNCIGILDDLGQGTGIFFSFVIHPFDWTTTAVVQHIVTVFCFAVGLFFSCSFRAFGSMETSKDEYYGPLEIPLDFENQVLEQHAIPSIKLDPTK